jgi:hypothetical protein
VRAHVFLCMLACHVEWHMRERLKPILFDESQIRRLSTSMSRGSGPTSCRDLSSPGDANSEETY